MGKRQRTKDVPRENFTHRKKELRELIGKTKTTKHVPEEIIEEILTNLPVKSLLRFKSVSKSWHSLICAKTFTNTHLNKNANHHQRLLLCSRDLSFSSSSLELLLNDSQGYSPIPIFQCRGSDLIPSIVGSCNGLILLAFESPCDLILLNPSTKQVNNNIPPHPLGPQGYGYFVYGFGYDVSTDDYKIVTIFISYNTESLETHMYSLKTNSWKKIANFADKGCYSINNNPGKYVNGKLHWKAGCGNTAAVIVSLDLAEDKYDFLACPQHPINNWYHLDVFGGNLCLVSSQHQWFMKKYGDPESWTRSRNSSHYHIPIWLAENGDVSVALVASMVIIYDRRTKSCTFRINRVDVGDIKGHCIYVETLVSPFGHQDLGQ